MSARKKYPATEQAGDVTAEPEVDVAERLVVFNPFIGEQGPELWDTSKTVAENLIDDPMLPDRTSSDSTEGAPPTEEPAPKETA